ncbi:hypothetical protein C8250_033955 [Streptomyces sp. So13.3]|uniref:hypothetical protein n=1 Tax=Streptomyces TaxID=1883 RepID=UPI0011061126|nr:MULTISPECIES: hypothetical protein [Streptomyces]MCZ4102853.1 hypothetical protein [Streptomyces sp. H39-C1]QNA76219.1 hypothetical protein C8250_033955 [Streptomyces sp. So13.3]
MLIGVLIGESLRVGSELNSVPLQVTSVRRIEVASATDRQPRQWTLLDLPAPEGDAGRLAGALADCLAPSGGWYVNYHTGAEAFVVFADRAFRYPRGNGAARVTGEEDARSVGVPEPQRDWED